MEGSLGFPRQSAPGTLRLVQHRHTDPMTSPKTYAALALACAAPALLAFGPKADSIAFAPSEGASVTKTFTSVMEFSMDEMDMLMNGQENPMMPSMEMDMVMTQSVTVSDTYGAMEGRRPKQVTRTFDAVANDIEMDMTVDAMGQVDEQSATGTGGSPLEGASVTFTWDADAGEYTKAFAEGTEGEAEHLEGLVEDMDLRGLLPSGEVSEGDEWDIPLRGLVDILAPGGNLLVEVEMDGQASAGGGPDPAMFSNVRDMLGDLLEGSATGKYVGSRDVDGVKLAVIELDIEIDTANDMSEFFEEMMADQIPAEIDMSLDRVDVEFALESSGELLWNMSGGHVHSMTLEGESAVSMEMEMGMNAGGQAMNMEMSMEMSGTLKNMVETE